MSGYEEACPFAPESRAQRCRTCVATNNVPPCAAAFLSGRDYVLPDDVQVMAHHVFPHRVVLTPKSKYDGTTKAGVIDDILQSVRVPT